MTIASCGGRGRARRRSSTTGSSRLSPLAWLNGLGGHLAAKRRSGAVRSNANGLSHPSYGGCPQPTTSCLETPHQAAARPRDVGKLRSTAGTHGQQNRRSEHILAGRTPYGKLHDAQGVRGSNPLRPTLNHHCRSSDENGRVLARRILRPGQDLLVEVSRPGGEGPKLEGRKEGAGIRRPVVPGDLSRATASRQGAEGFEERQFHRHLGRSSPSR